MGSTIPQFGEVSVRDAVLRPSGYAVILHEDRIAVVAAPGGLYLPGGGFEPGESAESAVARECREEAGLVIEVSRSLGMADEIVYTPGEGRYYCKRCVFFFARVTSLTEATEPDHLLLWLNPREAKTRLRHGSHRWAVEQSGLSTNQQARCHDEGCTN